MKIPVWIIGILVVACLAVVVKSCKDEITPVRVDPLQQQYDSIMCVVHAQDSFIAYQDSIIAHRDTIILEKIKYVTKQAHSVYGVDANNSLRTFIQWTRQFKNSAFRERYFRISSDSIY